MTTEAPQSNFVEADDIAHNSDGDRFVSVEELLTILNDRPVALLCNAIDRLDSSLAKVRTLYRSQLFSEAEQRNSDLGMADGSDCELVDRIGEELKEIRAVLKKALQQIGDEQKAAS